MSKDITGAQVRMARAFLGWPLAELARRAVVGISTIQAVEENDGPAVISGGPEQTLAHRTKQRAAVVEAIRKALTAAGITFLPDDGKAGPGIRGKVKRP